MNTEQKDDSWEARLNTLEHLLQGIDHKLDSLIEKDAAIGDWVKEEEIKRVTGLGKTSLYQLRKKFKVSSSTIAGRGVFYRLSDFENLLNKNETS